MDLTQIRFFLALARTLNFTRAAEQCFVTQPALTKSIQRLEGELGGKLLLRERGHTQLTGLGQTMLPLLQQTYDAAERARRGAQGFHEQDRSELRLGVGRRVEPALLAPLIHEVKRRLPALEVTLRQGSGGVLSDGLLSSQLDLVLTEDVSRLTARAHRWQIYADPVVVVFSDGHAIGTTACDAADPVAAATLRTEPLIGRTDADLPEGECGLEEAYALTDAIRHRVDSEAHLCLLVQATHGVALSTKRRVIPAGLRSRVLEPRQAVVVWLAALAGRPLSIAAEAFLRLARARDWDD